MLYQTVNSNTTLNNKCKQLYLSGLTKVIIKIKKLPLNKEFNSKTLIIPQGAVLLWSWWAHKKYIKLRKQYNKQKSLTLTVA